MKIIKENRDGAEVSSRAIVISPSLTSRSANPSLALTVQETKRSGGVNFVSITLTPSEFAAIAAAGWKILDGAS